VRRHPVKSLFASTGQSPAASPAPAWRGRDGATHALRGALVGIGGKDQVDDLHDPLSGAGAGERMDTAVLKITDGVAAAVALLVDRA
jgi:hypothetical protein